MSYVPFYRKYRPQKLVEIVGQEHIKKALANAIKLNKISHAYLFTGPRGTGKTSTARIFAKSLNCKNGPTITPCGVCENCIDITNSTPMDVIEIDAASNRKVEDAQNILEKVMYAPVNSRYKIYIIDEVHMLSATAFNALLKTLEEPPENVIFILATTEVHKVLDTIKSRCQRFDFKRISTQDIVNHLKFIAQKEKINITDDALNTIAKNSAGGMRDSIALLDQLSVLGSNEEITTDDINNLLGRLSFDILFSLTDKILGSNPNQALDIIESIYNSGNEPVLVLNNLTEYLKNLLIVKNCDKNTAMDLTQINEYQINQLLSQTGKIETHQIVALIDKCADYIREIKYATNPKLWLEVAIIDLANLSENTKLSQLQERIAKLECSNPSNVTYKTPIIRSEISVQEKATEVQPKNELKEQVGEQVNQEFSPMPKSKTTQHSDISVLWGNLLNNITSTPTRALLKQWANPVKISPEETVLSLKNEIFLNQLQSGSKKQAIVDAVNTLFSQTNSVVVVRLSRADDIEVKPLNNVRTASAEAGIKINYDEEIKEDIEADAEKDVEKDVEEDIEAEVKEINSRKDESIYSDNVKMIIDVFDGKVIE